MLLNESVEIKWTYRNRKHFESKGYKFTNINDVLIVKISDLTTGSPVRIKLKCDYCGKEYECYYYSYVNSHAMLEKDACHNCSATKGREVNKIKRAEKYFSQLKDMCDNYGYELVTTIDEYAGTKMYIEYICPKHGLQKSILYNMLKGHLCNECGNEKIGNILRNDIGYVKNYIESFNNNIWLNPEDYIDTKARNLKIQCGICGKIFTINFNNYRRMPRKQCNTCTRKESDGEEIIRKYLDGRVNFVQEKRFLDCKDKKSLPFDFYLPDYNMCIEFDGQQHYEPVYGQDRYEKTVLHDNIKNEYCKKNNIYLLRIPYWEGHHIEQIIKNELNRIKI